MILMILNDFDDFRWFSMTFYDFDETSLKMGLIYWSGVRVRNTQNIEITEKMFKHLITIIETICDHIAC